jgi:hypothetical protein
LELAFYLNGSGISAGKNGGEPDLLRFPLEFKAMIASHSVDFSALK